MGRTIALTLILICYPVVGLCSLLYDESKPRCSGPRAISLVTKDKKKVAVCAGIAKFSIGDEHDVTRSGKTVGRIKIEKVPKGPKGEVGGRFSQDSVSHRS